jgi:hypothetical protein
MCKLEKVQMSDEEIARILNSIDKEMEIYRREDKMTILIN